MTIQYQYPFKSKFVFGTPYGKKGSLWKCGWHSGLDMKSTNYGGDGKVYPIAAGVVKAVAWSSSYGTYVMVQHDDGYLSLYAHMKNTLVRAGESVELNTVLGREGTTGNSTGIHLHLEVHKGEYHYPSNIDPMQHIEHMIEEAEKVPVTVKTKLLLNGKLKEVQTIQHDGFNFIKLRDLGDERIRIDYNAAQNLPVVEVVK